MPFEVGKKLRMEIKKTVSDSEESSMERTWIDFCRAKNIDQFSTIGDHAIASAWMEYAHSHYQAPLPVASEKSWND